jgi:hypothetical protein
MEIRRASRYRLVARSILDVFRVLNLIRPGDTDRRSTTAIEESAIVKTVAHLSIGLLERYALNRVSEREVQRVQGHVAGCSECKALLERVFVWATGKRSPVRTTISQVVKAKGNRERGSDETGDTAAKAEQKSGD